MRNERLSFGKYQVLASLGQGGMGRVYLAMSIGPGGVQKLVVVKQLREDFATSLAARSMFLDEARISTRLNHPNIVQTNEVVDEEDDLYLVMEFLDGQPLSRILDPLHAGAFSLPAKLRILADALEGLHYAHELKDYDGTPLNVVHRDVSPQNIIVTYDGHVKLVDFGVAKAADAQTVTESGVFKGKVRYASPEQALCVASVDRRADVFAVGTVLWEIVCGRRLWQDQADASVLLALAGGKIPRIRDASTNVPPALEAICAKALSIDPAARYATAQAFRVALLDYLGDEADAVKLGAAVSSEFGKERRQLHTVIDAEMKAARDASSGAMTVRAIPLIGPDAASSLASERSILRGGLSIESERRSRPMAPPRKSSGWGIGLAAAGLAAIGAAVAFFPSRKTASANANPTVSTPAAVADSRVHLSLHATPPGARFILDGVTLASNPFEGDVPRDDAPHHLSIQADGFESRDLDPRFSGRPAVAVAPS
jgi:serine/threonine-protein kinase